MCNCRSRANGYRYNLIFRSAQIFIRVPYQCLYLCEQTHHASCLTRVVKRADGRVPAAHQQACVNTDCAIVNHHSAMSQSAPTLMLCCQSSLARLVQHILPPVPFCKLKASAPAPAFRISSPASHTTSVHAAGRPQKIAWTRIQSPSACPATCQPQAAAMRGGLSQCSPLYPLRCGAAKLCSRAARAILQCAKATLNRVAYAVVSMIPNTQTHST